MVTTYTHLRIARRLYKDLIQGIYSEAGTQESSDVTEPSIQFLKELIDNAEFNDYVSTYDVVRMAVENTIADLQLEYNQAIRGRDQAVEDARYMLRAMAGHREDGLFVLGRFKEASDIDCMVSFYVIKDATQADLLQLITSKNPLVAEWGTKLQEKFEKKSSLKGRIIARGERWK